MDSEENGFIVEGKIVDIDDDHIMVDTGKDDPFLLPRANILEAANVGLGSPLMIFGHYEEDGSMKVDSVSGMEAVTDSSKETAWVWDSVLRKMVPAGERKENDTDLTHALRGIGRAHAPEGMDEDTLEQLVQHSATAPLRKRGTTDDATIRNYLVVKEILLLESRSKKEDVILGDLKVIQSVWSAISRAKLFEVSPTSFFDIIEQAKDFALGELGCGLGDAIDKQLLHPLAQRTATWPDKRPFPHLYVSLGEGCPVHELDIILRESKEGIIPLWENQYNLDIIGMSILGYVMSPSEVWRIVAPCTSHTVGSDREWPMGFAVGNEALKHGRKFSSGYLQGTFSVPMPVYTNREWHPLSECIFDAWGVSMLLELINSFRTFTEEVPKSLKYRRSVEKLGKHLDIKKPIPPPYYRVELQDVLVRDRVRTRFPTGRRLGHRHDRRGHERCRFRRGKMPMDPKLEEKLRGQGYKIFKSGPLDVHTGRRLAVRGMPLKRHDEWLAVKTSWVKNCVVGSEELPYVPSIHTVPGAAS